MSSVDFLQTKHQSKSFAFCNQLTWWVIVGLLHLCVGEQECCCLFFPSRDLLLEQPYSRISHSPLRFANAWRLPEKANLLCLHLPENLNLGQKTEFDVLFKPNLHNNNSKWNHCVVTCWISSAEPCRDTDWTCRSSVFKQTSTALHYSDGSMPLSGSLGFAANLSSEA